MSFMVATDTSSNLPGSWSREHQVVVTPLSYHWQGSDRTCEDPETFDSHTYYTSLRGGAAIATAQVNPARFCESWRPFLTAGQDILFVGLSSGVSGTYASAEMAAVQLREEYPQRTIATVDSLGASLGLGLLVMRAAALRDAGQSLAEIVAALTAMRSRIYQIFTVDDLQFLRRGGRLSQVKAMVGTLLNIKPLLKGSREGQIISCGKIRGRRHAIEAMAQRYGELVVRPKEQRVGISQADCPEDAAYLAELVQRQAAPQEIQVVPFEPVTGSHAGPGALALFFEGTADVRNR